MRKFLIVCAVTTLTVASCTSYKNVPYLQNSENVILKTSELYDARIMPKDILTITVVCPENPQATQVFNLSTSVSATTNSFTSQSQSTFSTQMNLQSYLVENDGTINFPVLGRLKVTGLTKVELENRITDMIYGTYLKERPVVTVNMSNYKIAVLGEVASPGVYTVSNGKVNVFEALALAKDMTIYGRRDSVKIIRESLTGQKEIACLNLGDANIINSPFYQLQQNDIVYVIPNKAKAKNSGVGSETSLWFTSTSILVSLASLLYNILK